MKFLGILLEILTLVFITTTELIRSDEIIIHGDSTLRCTRELNRVTCHTTYEYDVDAICDASHVTGEPHSTAPTVPTVPRDCHDIFLSGSTNDGIYSISPTGWSGAPFEVSCKMSHDGGWTVFQRRQDGSVPFNRPWDHYKQGFGTPRGELWLGNDKLHLLTHQRDYKMRIDLTNEDGEPHYLQYDMFQVGDEASDYMLTLGDDLEAEYNTGYDYMAFHNGMRFSTYDNDNDMSPNSCSAVFHGGWWYNYCFDANLNGDYSESDRSGVCVYNRHSGVYQYNLSFTEMTVRPA